MFTGSFILTAHFNCTNKSNCYIFLRTVFKMMTTLFRINGPSVRGIMILILCLLQYACFILCFITVAIKCQLMSSLDLHDKVTLPYRVEVGLTEECG